MDWTEWTAAAGRGLALAIGMLAAACGGSTPTGPTAPSPPAPTYTLTGMVIENASDGSRPVAGAIVTHGVSGKTSTTDASGVYNITGITPSPATITATKDGYLVTTRSVTITGETRLDLVLTRTPPPAPAAYVIAGTVTERVGSFSVPVAGAVVEDAYSRRSVTTGTDGRYRIELADSELGRSDGFVQFWARKQGFVPAVHERAIWEDTTIDFEISRQ